MNNNKFNLIGFNFNKVDKQHRHCSIHPGTRLIEDDDPDLLRCPDCGTSYPLNQTSLDQKITSDIGPQSTKIFTPSNKKKKYYDQAGNELPADDPDVQKDLARGYKYIYYKEDKPE